MNYTLTQCEPNHVNEPIESSPDIPLSLAETLSLPSPPSETDITQLTTSLTSFPSQLNDTYQELQKTSKPICLYWNSFVVPPPPFEQHIDSSRLHYWALSRLQYRHEITP